MAPGDQHHCTPKKAQIIGTVGFLRSQHRPFITADIFRYFGVSQRQGWDILRQGRERRHLEHETRGRKKILTLEDLSAMKEIIWKFGFETRALTWQGLAFKAGIVIELSYRTIQRTIDTLDYQKYIACKKG